VEKEGLCAEKFLNCYGVPSNKNQLKLSLEENFSKLDVTEEVSDLEPEELCSTKMEMTNNKRAVSTETNAAPQAGRGLSSILIHF
jgi:hypothetical protein